MMITKEATGMSKRKTGTWIIVVILMIAVFYGKVMGVVM